MGIVYNVPYSETPPTLSELQQNGLIIAYYNSYPSPAISASKSGGKAAFYTASTSTIGAVIAFSEQASIYIIVRNAPTVYSVDTLTTSDTSSYGFPYGRVSSNFIGYPYPNLTLNVELYETQESAISAIASAFDSYPITYHYTNSTVSGPSEAAVGDTVTVSAVPNNNYGITDPATQILVTNNDVAVSYNWNPSTNTITFVMPDPT